MMKYYCYDGDSSCAWMALGIAFGLKRRLAIGIETSDGNQMFVCLNICLSLCSRTGTSAKCRSSVMHLLQTLDCCSDGDDNDDDDDYYGDDDDDDADYNDDDTAAHLSIL